MGSPTTTSPPPMTIRQPLPTKQPPTHPLPTPVSILLSPCTYPSRRRRRCNINQSNTKAQALENYNHHSIKNFIYCKTNIKKPKCLMYLTCVNNENKGVIFIKKKKKGFFFKKKKKKKKKKS